MKFGVIEMQARIQCKSKLLIGQSLSNGLNRQILKSHQSFPAISDSYTMQCLQVYRFVSIFTEF